MKERLIVIGITVALILILVKLYQIFKEKIHFFASGNQNGFKLGEINLLWKLAQECSLEEPDSLYISVPTLNRAITNYITAARENGTEETEKVQTFLTKLYDYRTKINLDHENKKGIESTKYLDNGQRLRIILPGSGVFKSVILNNGYELTIKLPTQDNIIKVQGENWINRDISVYLWRKGDANYVFDTRVTNSGVFQGQAVLYLAQTNDLLRTQKRRSVRSECNLSAHMFFLQPDERDFNEISDESTGYRCLLEDISEDGAMIRIGGMGKVDSQIKLQFKIGENLIMMFGIVRAVEYNKKFNQSRLHFECIHLEQEMKNRILSFVYNILPPEEKDVFDALIQTEEDEKIVEAEAAESSESQVNPEENNAAPGIILPETPSQVSIEDLAAEDVNE